MNSNRRRLLKSQLASFILMILLMALTCYKTVTERGKIRSLGIPAAEKYLNRALTPTVPLQKERGEKSAGLEMLIGDSRNQY